MLETLSGAAADPRLSGVLLELGAGVTGFAAGLSLRRAVAAVREAGRPVAVYAESLDACGLLVASAADEIWMPEAGALLLVGLRFEGTYLRGLLERLRVAPEVVRIGSHKSAGERFTRDAMSPQEREQLELLADDFYDELVRGIAAGRDLPEQAVRDLIDRGPYRGAAAREAGLVDRCLYPDQVDDELLRLTPAPPEPAGPRRLRRIEGSLYHRLRAGGSGPWLASLPRLAYVVAQGAIHRGGAGRGGIACDPLRELLGDLRADGSVRGVVLRLESPGGDGLASELLWRAVSRLREEKPVVVSMGEVVGSGGYYLAAAADALYAEAASVTGSIGVLAGKANLEGLYAGIGVARDAVERGARAGLMSEARGFRPDERAALRRELEAVYRDFLDRVSRGRGMPPETLEPLAGGRIWSGARARRNGLVDGLGGPLEALHEVRRRAGLRPDEPVEIDVHPRRRRPGLRGLLALARGLSGPG